MPRLTRAPSLLLAQHWLNLLQQARVPAVLQNTHLQGVMGEIPVDQCAPEIWIDNEADRELAMRVIGLAGEPAVPALHWFCPACGEHLEAQFSACWRCGAERP
ncbi:putative signal transducing protein [Bordetella trematum]|uniref:putative signal transducing protein n=1 Tax=Bordetella trematum TaxID=123899 RepID=UPI003AF3970F